MNDNPNNLTSDSSADQSAEQKLTEATLGRTPSFSINLPETAFDKLAEALEIARLHSEREQQNRMRQYELEEKRMMLTHEINRLAQARLERADANHLRIALAEVEEKKTARRDWMYFSLVAFLAAAIMLGALSYFGKAELVINLLKVLAQILVPLITLIIGKMWGQNRILKEQLGQTREKSKSQNEKAEE